MSKIVAERVSATPSDDFVVFLIGMRINRFWKVHKWIPPMVYMTRMLKQLNSQPSEETGCLGTYTATPGLTVVYWRSFEDLEAFAHGEFHQPAWAKFNKSMAKARGDVGIWHETYIVPAGNQESLYSGMPPHGLGKAFGVVPAVGAKNSARDRLKK